MRMLFACARLALLVALASLLSVGGGFLLALFIFYFFESLSGFIAYRRLCSRLGVAHQIWANADRFENLPYLGWSGFPTWALSFWWKPGCALILVRGISSSLRGWWVLQTIYEVVLAVLVLVATAYLVGRPAMLNWSTLPYAFAAVVILASKRAMTIYAPEKYFPKS